MQACKDPVWMASSSYCKQSHFLHNWLCRLARTPCGWLAAPTTLLAHSALRMSLPQGNSPFVNNLTKDYWLFNKFVCTATAIPFIYSFSGNICFKFSAFCLCSVIYFSYQTPNGEKCSAVLPLEVLVPLLSAVWLELMGSPGSHGLACSPCQKVCWSKGPYFQWFFDHCSHL